MLPIYSLWLSKDEIYLLFDKHFILHSVPSINVNTDHASVSLLAQEVTSVDNVPFRQIMSQVIASGGYGSSLTGIHRSKNNRHIYLHKSFSTRASLDVVGGIDRKLFGALDVKDKRATKRIIEDRTLQLDALELEEMLIDAGSCGVMVRSWEEFEKTPHVRSPF